ncbi:MAG: hypothetical protein LBE13_02125 [Bacteroidales bacterium]|jgi:hypothetical protein|nr:hypothetical protein [Bacteroidales bacterium]
MSDINILERRLYDRYSSGAISTDMRDVVELGGIGAADDNQRAAIRCPDTAPNNPTHTSRGVAMRNSIQFNNQHDFESNDLIRGGYDGGVEVGFDGEWVDFQSFTLLQKLADAARASVTDDSNSVFFTFNDLIYYLWLKGSGGAIRYKYVFEFDGVRFYVHSNPKGQIQPIRVHYNAIGLIGVDFFKKHDFVVSLIESWGFSISCEKISRVDLQVLVPFVMSNVSTAIEENRVVCYARDAKFYSSGLGNSFNSFSLGKNLKIRIYDKLLEMKSMMLSDPVKFSLMLKFCVGPEFYDVNANLMRVEFSLLRDVLKDFSIHSVSDLHDNENLLIHYLCEKWFRVLKFPKDVNRHTSGQELSSWWLDVISEFDRWFPGKSFDGVISRVNSRQLEVLNCSPLHLDRQAIGCLASSFVYRLGICRSSDFYEHVADWFRNNYVKIYERYRERCEVLSVAKIKQSELEGETYDEALDPRVLNEMAIRLRSADFFD